MEEECKNTSVKNLIYEKRKFTLCMRKIKAKSFTIKNFI